MRSPLSIVLFGLGLTAFATPPKATFSENKGQWPEEVLYRTLVPGGALFVERSAFTFVLFSDSPLRHHGHAAASGATPSEGRAHAYRVHFEGGRAESWSGTLQQPHYENYFLGNDPAHWGTRCGVFGEVLLKDVWPGIDIRISGEEGIKYDLLIRPGAHPGLIRMRYEGQDGLALKDGALHVRLSNGEIVEERPVSWISLADGVDNIRASVPSPYHLSGSTVSFDVEAPAGLPLTIDPTLTFASYSGSTGNNFGYTATYDNTGHLYGGGIVFDIGYPLTLGALQNFWAGGSIDAGITKWSPDGSTLIWSTYLGGSGAEGPHSLVVNEQEELFVMGSTGSFDLPTTAGAFDVSFNGGGVINNWAPVNISYGFDHNNGTDIYVSHFSADATTLIGSTFIGGSGNDGLNAISPLTHNYGDHFRGEITLDSFGSPVVATSTQSNDMPTNGAPQPVYGGGGQDGYVFRMNSALTTLWWATYRGGSGADNALGVQLDSNDQIFVSGGTTSTDLPMAGAPVDNSFNGVCDGYVARYSGAGIQLLSSTFLGTSAYDQAYFVQLSASDEVFVVGQTHGAYPVTPGKYSDPGSSQFLHKLSHDLNTSIWSTRLGNGSSSQDLSPTAFLVSDCGQIYLSGWAGEVNDYAGNTNSTTTGSPTTPDAFQGSTDGSDFLLMVLAPEAASLAYSTYFGGGISHEHVDGGTSRFDKNGTVYHAVCAGCGGNDDFPTTPGAWSTTNNSSCNLGVFKFELSPTQAVIGIDGPTTACLTATVQFTNSSVGGTDFQWDFGDGSPSTNAFAPTHVFDELGEFTVTMVLTDNTGCLEPDTATIQITVQGAPVAEVQDVDPVCPEGNTQLHASGGTTYAWSPNIGLSAVDVPDPISTPPQTMVYTVVVSDACGSDTAEVDVQVIDPQTTLLPDTSVCLGEGIVLIATGGDTYAWTPAQTLDDPSLGSPTATPDTATTYTVTITTPDGCTVTDSLFVEVFDAPPLPLLRDTTICFGTSVQLVATPADVYNWHPANGITTLHVGSPIVSPTEPTLYIVDLSNACGALTDSAFVDLVFVTADAWPDTLVCPGFPVQLGATGGTSYLWTPAAGLTNDTIADPVATPAENTVYQLVAFDAIGCTDTAVVRLDLHAWPVIHAGEDMSIEYGDVVQLTASGEGIWTWAPTNGLSDSTSMAPFVQPEVSTTYTVTTTNELGCKNTDVLVIVVSGSLYLPNTFTPNGDTFNDTFGALGKEIKDFELLVFNRWGELIWQTDQLSGRWDGTYKGVESPIDTYVWRVLATEINGRYHEQMGHVNLVR